MTKYFTNPLSIKETNIYVKYLFSLDSTLDGKKDSEIIQNILQPYFKTKRQT